MRTCAPIPMRLLLLPASFKMIQWLLRTLKAVPRPAWISPEQAARAGVKGLEAGERVIVPGLQVRAAMQAARILPHAVKLPALEWMMRGR